MHSDVDGQMPTALQYA